MCHDLKLDFDAFKDYVLCGLFSRELAMYTIGRKRMGKDNLLENL